MTRYSFGERPPGQRRPGPPGKAHARWLVLATSTSDGTSPPRTFVVRSASEARAEEAAKTAFPELGSGHRIKVVAADAPAA